MTSIGVAVLLGVLALAAVGCASTDGGAGSSPVATTSVDMPKSYRFAPATITVEAGSTVTWTNSDNFTHSVRLDGQEPLVAAPGASVESTFDAPGTYRYDCSFHPQDMQGTVIVTGS